MPRGQTKANPVQKLSDSGSEPVYAPERAPIRDFDDSAVTDQCKRSV
jgi:hypothetical protein